MVRSMTGSVRPRGQQTAASSTGETVYVVAVDLMFDRGYHGTSLRDLAKAVGVQMSSLYHYYPSKQALLVAIMDGTMADLVAGGTAAMAAAGGGPRAKLIAGIRHHVLFQTERRKECLITDTEIRSLEPENRVRNVRMRDSYERLFADALEDGCESGAFSVGDVKVAVAGLFAMLNGVAAWYRPDGRRTLDEIADQYCEIFLNGVAGRRLAVAPVNGAA